MTGAYAQIIGDVQGVGAQRTLSYRWEGDSDLALVDTALALLWEMPGARERRVGYQFSIGSVCFYVRSYDAARKVFVVERVVPPALQNENTPQ